MSEEHKSHEELVRAYLNAGHSITALQALQRFGCFRLASVVNRLRNGKDGQPPMDIDTNMSEEANSAGQRKRFANYRKAAPKQAPPPEEFALQIQQDGG